MPECDPFGLLTARSRLRRLWRDGRGLDSGRGAFRFRPQVRSRALVPSWQLSLDYLGLRGTRTPVQGRTAVAAAVVAALLAVVVPLGLASGGAAGGFDCAPSWRELPGPAVLDGELVSVAADAVDDAWAVGASPADFPARGPSVHHSPLIEHWDGTAWTLAAAARFDGTLLDVAAIGSADVWAIGFTRTGAAVIEHWNGSSWRRLSVPWSARLWGVTATGANDVWAVGNNGAGAMVLHWDGTRWLRVMRRQKAELFDVAALSPSDIWAVGSEGETRLLLVHWDGVRWRAYEVRPPAGDDMPVNLEGVAAVSGGDVWAVGGAHIAELNGYDSDPIVLHWDGRRWSYVRPPHEGEASLTAIAAASDGRVFTAGVDIFPFATEDGADSFVTLRLERDGRTRRLRSDSSTA